MILKSVAFVGTPRFTFSLEVDWTRSKCTFAYVASYVKSKAPYIRLLGRTAPIGQ